jgi:hypothetical protein
MIRHLDSFAAGYNSKTIIEEKVFNVDISRSLRDLFLYLIKFI